MTVQILLSAYNGAAYLPSQLDSLAAQTCAPELTLLTRDDGSTDSTRSILESFSGLPSQTVRGENIGVVASFLELMRLADPDAEFYMFCDQDDVWDADKCAVALDHARRNHNPDRPYLYCSRSRVTDQDLQVLGLTRPVPKGPSFANALIQNIAPGHTFFFNRRALELGLRLADPDRIVLHDSWLYLVCSATGTVEFDDTPHTSYRTHAGSTVGYAMNAWQQARARVKNLLWVRSAHTRQNALLMERDPGLCPAHAARLRAFVTSQNSLRARLRALRAFPLVHQSPAAQVVATALFACGAYRTKWEPAARITITQPDKRGSLDGYLRGTNERRED